MIKFLLVASLFSGTARASDNGGYYTCDATTLASDNKCVFALTGTQPTDWIQTPVKHDLDRTVGADFFRGVQGYAGDMLSVSPKPWVNGDVLVGSDAALTGDVWIYALIFELMAPLRDMMMYEPDLLTEDVWNAYTKALTDCMSKTEDYVASRSGGTPYSTGEVYAFLKDPQYKDIHHYILQYLEEGAMDLVCLSTPDLVMDHCDTIRATAGADAAVGDRCNCWFDAYAALYGACPVVDVAFTTCANTASPTTCSDTTAVDSGDSSTDTDGTDETAGTDTGVPTGKGSGGPAGIRK